MTQTRTILTAAANGGTACGPSSQSASCGNDACPGTGVCTVSTTAGKRCNSPVVDDTGVTLTQCQDEATAAGMSHFSWRSNKGGSCEIPTDNSESQCVTNARNKGSWSVYTITCTSGGAAVDCEQSAWIDGTCSATCGGGTMTQTRSILTAAANGGTACGPSSQSASCGNDACPGGASDPCDPDPCQNGATCTDNGGTFSCTCANGFSGNTCDVGGVSARACTSAEQTACRSSPFSLPKTSETDDIAKLCRKNKRESRFDSIEDAVDTIQAAPGVSYCSEITLLLEGMKAVLIQGYSETGWNEVCDVWHVNLLTCI